MMLHVINTIHEGVTTLAALGRLGDQDLDDYVIIEELEVAVPREVAELFNPAILRIFKEGRQLYKDLKKVGVTP